MQTVTTTETMDSQALTSFKCEDCCQVDIFADEDLYFNVRVICGSKRYVAGGFMSPDEAQRRGVAAMLVMHDLAQRR